MGFGYGRTTYHDNKAAYRYSDGARVKMIMPGAMVAHVWNSQTQDFGRSNNGNFFFRDSMIFSYGSHYLVGMILPDGVALINSERNSVTTQGHVSDASSACRNRTRYWLDDLTSLESWLSSVACTLANLRGTQYGTKEKAAMRADMRKRALKELREHADKLLDLGSLADTSGERWSPRIETGVAAGEYLAKLCGLTAQSWQRAKRLNESDAAAVAKQKAAIDKANALKQATDKATQSESDFRDNCRHWLKNYGEHFIKTTATEFFRARKLAKESGFSAKRLATLKAREQYLRNLAANFEKAKQIARAREQLLTDIRGIRNAPTQLASFTRPMTPEGLKKLTDCLDRLGTSARVPRATRVGFVAMAIQLRKGLPYLERRQKVLKAREYARNLRERSRSMAERAERAEKAKQAWLAGENVALPSSFNVESGGPALRVYGNELQTSWGASVPLAHAIKAFRFVKLCKESGRTFARNGKTIRVGHFQVDRIESDGSFKAGCHSFSWPEVERVAKLAGVFTLSADDSAIEESH